MKKTIALAFILLSGKAEDFDFRLKPNAVAIDRGLALPNINEGFTGRAPDLGALEAGKPVPHYGPRP